MTAKMRALVVDDEEKIRDGCRRVLTGNGYEVTTLGNGQVALEYLEKEPVDIILLDLKMPVMGGEQMLEHVCHRHPDIPVIIITGHGTIDTAVDCMKRGAYDFITKPFQIKQFMLTINRAAEKRSLELKARQLQQENIRNLYDLNLEKSRLKTIINCLANGVMVTNRNLEVVLHNPALLRLIGITSELELPAPASSALKDAPFLETLKQIQSGACPADGFISQEFVSSDKTLRAISAPALGPDQTVVGTVTALEDITAFKQLDQMKSDFINMVAHELRSPLYAVRQLLTVQLEGLCGPLQDKQTDYLDRAVKQIDSLLELIRDLLDISKVEAGILVQHSLPVDLEQIIEDTLDMMEIRAKAQGVAFHFSRGNVKPIQADPKSMEDVFNNLIDNAINYSPDGGRIQVEIRTLGEFVEVKVSDNGIGIIPEELPKIFDKFYRVKHPKTRQVIGSGLGLSLVKSIIEAHHGAIEVESVPQRGTTFRILLPVMK